MPEMDGWALARQLKEAASNTPIIMVSADAREGNAEERAQLVDDYVVKPVKVNNLLEKIAANLDLNWRYTDEIRRQKINTKTKLTPDDMPPANDLDDIKRLAEIGFAKGIKTKLDELEANNLASQFFISHIKDLVKGFEFKKIIKLVGDLT